MLLAGDEMLWKAPNIDPAEVCFHSQVSVVLARCYWRAARSCSELLLRVAHTGCPLTHTPTTPTTTFRPSQPIHVGLKLARLFQCLPGALRSRVAVNLSARPNPQHWIHAIAPPPLCYLDITSLAHGGGAQCL